MIVVIWHTHGDENVKQITVKARFPAVHRAAGPTHLHQAERSRQRVVTLATP